MVEGEAKEISESDMLAVLKFAQPFIKAICELQIEIRKETAYQMEFRRAAETDLAVVIPKTRGGRPAPLPRSVEKKKERSQRR